MSIKLRCAWLSSFFTSTWQVFFPQCTMCKPQHPTEQRICHMSTAYNVNQSCTQVVSCYNCKKDAVRHTKYAKYVCVIYNFDKGRDGQFKQHHPFTNTRVLCSQWSVESTGTPTQTLSLASYQENNWIAAAELNSRLLLRGFCVPPPFRLWS